MHPYASMGLQISTTVIPFFSIDRMILPLLSSCWTNVRNLGWHKAQLLIKVSNVFTCHEMGVWDTLYHIPPNDPKWSQMVTLISFGKWMKIAIINVDYMWIQGYTVEFLAWSTCLAKFSQSFKVRKFLPLPGIPGERSTTISNSILIIVLIDTVY